MVVKIENNLLSRKQKKLLHELNVSLSLQYGLTLDDILKIKNSGDSEFYQKKITELTSENKLLREELDSVKKGYEDICTRLNNLEEIANVTKSNVDLNDLFNEMITGKPSSTKGDS